MPLQGIPGIIGAGIRSAGVPGPSSITGLQVWLRADSYSLNDGDPISTDWTDLSGNSRAPSPINTPTFRTNQVNGKPVVEFTSASNEYFDSFNGWNPSGQTAGHGFIVIKVKNDPPAVDTASGLWYFGSTALDTHYPYTDSNIYDGFGSTTRQTVGDPTPSLATYRLYEVFSASNDWGALLDGASLFSTGTNTVGFNSAPRLGADNSPAVFINGFVAEFFLYNKKLSAGEQSTIYTYISNRYALSLP